VYWYTSQPHRRDVGPARPRKGPTELGNAEPWGPKSRLFYSRIKNSHCIGSTGDEAYCIVRFSAQALLCLTHIDSRDNSRDTFNSRSIIIRKHCKGYNRPNYSLTTTVKRLSGDTSPETLLQPVAPLTPSGRTSHQAAISYGGLMMTCDVCSTIIEVCSAGFDEHDEEILGLVSTVLSQDCPHAESLPRAAAFG
jgi:hypothetical protein